MGRRGPSPKPTALKLLTAPRGRPKKKSQEPRPAAGIPEIPSWLGREAKAEWKRLAPELLRLGLLTTIDSTALAAYCQSWCEFVECSKKIAKKGLMIDRPVYDRKGQQVGSRPIVNPLISVQNAAIAKLKTFITEFGLSPASRTRVKIEASSPEINALDELMARSRRGMAAKASKKKPLDEPGPYANTDVDES